MMPDLANERQRPFECHDIDARIIKFWTHLELPVLLKQDAQKHGVLRSSIERKTPEQRRLDELQTCRTKFSAKVVSVQLEERLILLSGLWLQIKRGGVVMLPCHA
jgi:hypothetical protein